MKDFYINVFQTKDCEPKEQVGCIGAFSGHVERQVRLNYLLEQFNNASMTHGTVIVLYAIIRAVKASGTIGVFLDLFVNKNCRTASEIGCIGPHSENPATQKNLNAISDKVLAGKLVDGQIVVVYGNINVVDDEYEPPEKRSEHTAFKNWQQQRKRINEDAEIALQALFEQFLATEMSKAQFLEIIQSTKATGKSVTLNSPIEWRLSYSCKEITGGKDFTFIPELICPFCEEPMAHDPERWTSGAWVCSPCDAAVSCFKGTWVPMGLPAFRNGRKLRAETHDLVKAMVEKAGGYGAHKFVYRWMAGKLGYNPDERFITLASVTSSELVSLQHYVREWLRSDDPSKVDALFIIG